MLCHITCIILISRSKQKQNNFLSAKLQDNTNRQRKDMKRIKEIDDEKNKNKIKNDNENGNENHNSLNNVEKTPEVGNKYVSNLFSLSSTMIKRAQESTAGQVHYLQVYFISFYFILQDLNHLI